MKSERAQTLFSELIDVNWEIKQHRENNFNSPNFYSDLLLLEDKYEEIKNDLIEEMGLKEYYHFVNLGRIMFAPKLS